MKRSLMLSSLLMLMLVLFPMNTAGAVSTKQYANEFGMQSGKNESALAAGDILVVQNGYPWGTNIDFDILTQIGHTYYTITMESIGTIDLSVYPVVMIANDQPQAFYDSYAQQVSIFENYVRNGGTLLFFAADGFSYGVLRANLPGGVVLNTPIRSAYNFIQASSHPIASGLLSDGIPLTDGDLYGKYSVSCSQGYFWTLPSGAITIFTEDAGNPTMIEYPLGSGRVIASTNPWEYSYIHGDVYARKALDDIFLYAFIIDEMQHTELPVIFR